jgi:hypothetical protein
MLFHELDGNDGHLERDTTFGTRSPGMTRRMRRGVVRTAAGIVLLSIVTILAMGGLAMPGGVKLPGWAWIVSLATGVSLVGFGFGTIVDEAARLSREEVEADRVSQKLDEGDEPDVA